MEHLLLDGPRGEKPVDGHGPRLPVAPDARHRLAVVSRVPARVEEHQARRAHQVQTRAARHAREQHRAPASPCVERLDQRRARVRRRAPVQPVRTHAKVRAHRAREVQRGGEPGYDHHALALACVAQRLHDGAERAEFSGPLRSPHEALRDPGREATPQVRGGGVRGGSRSTQRDVGLVEGPLLVLGRLLRPRAFAAARLVLLRDVVLVVVAPPPRLRPQRGESPDAHRLVHGVGELPQEPDGAQRRRGGPAPAPARPLAHDSRALFVQRPLRLGGFAEDDNLRLRRQVRGVDGRLAAEHAFLREPGERARRALRLLDVARGRAGLAAPAHGLSEPPVELVRGAEQAGTRELHHRRVLVQVVLHGRPGEQNAHGSLDLAQRRERLRLPLRVPEPVRLVAHHNFRPRRRRHRREPAQGFVRRDQDGPLVECAFGVRGRALRPAPVRLVGAAALRERSLRAHASQPLAHLRAPVADQRGGAHEQRSRGGGHAVRPLPEHRPDERQRLQRLAQPHVVREQTPGAVDRDLGRRRRAALRRHGRKTVDGAVHPAHTLSLVGAEFPREERIHHHRDPARAFPQAQRLRGRAQHERAGCIRIMQRPELRQRRPGERHVLGRRGHDLSRRRRLSVAHGRRQDRSRRHQVRRVTHRSSAPPGRRHHRVRLCGRRSRGRGTRHRASPACAPRCVFPASEYFNIFNSG